MPLPTKDLTGQSFGRWTIMKFAGYQRLYNKKKLTGAVWECKCECGATKHVPAGGLLGGKSKSCGCLARDTARVLARQLGLDNTRNEGPLACRQLYARYQGDARRMGRAFEISYERAVALFAGNCTYCGEPPSLVSRVRDSVFPYNGIDRVDNLRGYTDDNCASCCKKCNETKRSMTVKEFSEYIRKVYATLFGGVNADV